MMRHVTYSELEKSVGYPFSHGYEFLDDTVPVVSRGFQTELDIAVYLLRHFGISS